MRKKLAEHIGSILVVGLVFGVLIVTLESHEAAVRESRLATVSPYLSLQFLDFGNPLHRALFKETLRTFRPDSARTNEALLEAIDSYREAQFTDPSLKPGSEHGLTWSVIGRLTGMYAGFLFVFGVVLLLTLYAAQSLAIYRFVQVKQEKESALRVLWTYLAGTGSQKRRPNAIRVSARSLLLIFKAVLKGCVYLVLFSPAYVIGYALKTRVETDSILFMILLGLISNGLLMTYANKFFTLMVTESRKGYVETALAKGLSGHWVWNRPEGIHFGSVMRLRKKFPSHVLGHIFLNARYQYLPTLKEQGSFLITGLIIGEMALNIQGHLGYELLQKLLYKQYDVALVITFGIFLVVKVTEILVDWRISDESRKYENIR